MSDFDARCDHILFRTAKNQSLATSTSSRTTEFKTNMAGMDGNERESGTKQLQESSPDYIAGQDAEEPPDPPASTGAWKIRQIRFDIICPRAAPRDRPRRPRHRRPGHPGQS